MEVSPSLWVYAALPPRSAAAPLAARLAQPSLATAPRSSTCLLKHIMSCALQWVSWKVEFFKARTRSKLFSPLRERQRADATPPLSPDSDSPQQRLLGAHGTLCPQRLISTRSVQRNVRLANLGVEGTPLRLCRSHPVRRRLDGTPRCV